MTEREAVENAKHFLRHLAGQSDPRLGAYPTLAEEVLSRLDGGVTSPADLYSQPFSRLETCAVTMAGNLGPHR